MAHLCISRQIDVKETKTLKTDWIGNEQQMK